MTDLSAFSAAYLKAADYTFQHSADGRTVWLTPNEKAGIGVRNLSDWLPEIYAGMFPVEQWEVRSELARRGIFFEPAPVCLGD